MDFDDVRRQRTLHDMIKLSDFSTMINLSIDRTCFLYYSYRSKEAELLLIDKKANDIIPLPFSTDASHVITKIV